MTDKEPVDNEPTIEDYEKFRKLTVAQRHAFYLQLRNALETPRIFDAFSVVERGDFIPIEHYEGIFFEKPVGIGYEQTNSDPSLVSRMLEKLQPQRGENILDVGSGSGWTTALISHCVGETGKVVGVERIQELVVFGRNNIGKYRHTTNAEVHHTPNGIGWPEGAPYDKILVSAQIDKVPVGLVEQLDEGGLLLVPVVNTEQEGRNYAQAQFEQYKKRNGKELPEEDKQKFLDDILQKPGSNIILYKKVDGELQQVDVIPDMIFVPLILGDDSE
ncbi:MAG: hypothetical protein Q7T74_00825 [Candidatus Saccharibacteria bacterium]|nr:hypothetical protein [Candidatus Saccharibacteria bacterium]